MWALRVADDALHLDLGTLHWDLGMKRLSAWLRAGHDERHSVERPRRRALQAGSSYGAGVAFSLASFASIAIITLFTSVLSARLYGITVIGQAALALAPVAIVTLLSTVREQPAMVRELAKLEPRHPRVTGVFLAVFT